jgi:hypothetical protein
MVDGWDIGSAEYGTRRDVVTLHRAVQDVIRHVQPHAIILGRCTRTVRAPESLFRPSRPAC